jgi:hypothetical protein
MWLQCDIFGKKKFHFQKKEEKKGKMKKEEKMKLEAKKEKTEE